MVTMAKNLQKIVGSYDKVDRLLKNQTAVNASAAAVNAAKEIPHREERIVQLIADVERHNQATVAAIAELRLIAPPETGVGTTFVVGVTEP